MLDPVKKIHVSAAILVNNIERELYFVPRDEAVLPKRKKEKKPKTEDEVQSEEEMEEEPSADDTELRAVDYREDLMPEIRDMIAKCKISRLTKYVLRGSHCLFSQV